MVEVNEKWLSVAELAKLTKTPESTVRRHLKRFDPYFRYEERQRGRKYHPESVEILNKIVAFYLNEFSSDEIEGYLVRQHPISVVPVEETKEIDVVGGLLDRSMVTKDDIVILVQEMQAMRQEMTAIQQSNEEMKNENAMLHKQLADRINDRDQMLMETMRALQEQRKEIAAAAGPERKSFWARLLGK